MAFVPGAWQQQSPIFLSRATSVVAIDRSLRLDVRALGRVRGHFEGKPGHEHFAIDGRRPVTRLGALRAELVQVHVHRGSEHDVEGQEHEGEIHLVHEILHPAPHGSTLLVLGVLFETGERGPQLFEQWIAAPRSKAGSIDLRGIVPRRGRFYRYEGSLTTPPYTECVSWVVFHDPVKVSRAVLRKLARTEGPDRQHMPIDRRIVLRNFR